MTDEIKPMLFDGFITVLGYGACLTIDVLAQGACLTIDVLAQGACLRIDVLFVPGGLE